MSKILIVAATENIFEYQSQFSESGLSFDYLICNQNSKYNFGIFDQQSICVDNEMLAVQNQNQPTAMTQKKIATRKELGPQIRQLRDILNQYQNLKNKKSKKIKLSIPNSDHIYYLDQISDLVFNKKTNKIYLNQIDSAIQEYDHIYIEKTEMTVSALEKKLIGQNVWSTDRKNSFQFVGNSYFADQEFTEKSFWFMFDVNYKSTYDNLYFVSVHQYAEKKRLDVWSWLPQQYITNTSQVKYIQARIQKRFEKKFNFIKLNPVSAEKFILQPVNTQFSIKNKSESLITFFPGFSFLSQNTVAEVIADTNRRTIEKLKIKKENIETIYPKATL